MRTHNILMLAATLMAHSAAYSQIEVYGNGNVAVKGTLNTSNTALSVGDKSYNSSYSVYMSSNNPATGCYNIGAEGTALRSTTSSGRTLGVRGVAGNCTADWNFGVVGALQGNNNGAGVFGSASQPLGINTNGKYAGFFHGDMTATGAAKLCWANPCDAELSSSTSIQSALTIINSFHTKQGTPLIPATAGGSPQGDGNGGRPVSSEVHYAFIPSYTASTYPALVCQTAGGNSYVNYTLVIPILVEAVKQLYTMASSLSTGGAVTSGHEDGPATAPAMAETSRATFLQNITPNPFTTATVVRYQLPNGAGDAWLRIADMQDTPLHQIPLDTSADRVTINGNSLQPGMYICTLVVDGKDVDTKRMIFTK